MQKYKIINSGRYLSFQYFPLAKASYLCIFNNENKTQYTKTQTTKGMGTKINNSLYYFKLCENTLQPSKN